MYNEDFFAEPGVPTQAEVEAAKEQERLRAEQQTREAEAAAEQTATVEEQTASAPTPPIQAESEDPVETTEQPQQQTDDGMNNPVSQFLEGAAVEVRDWIDDKLQGNQQTKEEIRSGRAETRAQQQQASEDYISASEGGVLSESVRAVASGAEKQVKDIQEFGSLVGDTFKTITGGVEEGDKYNDIFADDYTALERDLVVAEPTTAVGLFARDMISFMGISNRVKALTGASKVNQAIGGINSKAGRWTARAGSEMIYGAIADLIVDPGDANASNLIIEKVPGAERFIGMFAIDEDDSAWEKRFKGMGDGAIMGLGVEGVGVLLRGSKIGARHLAKWAKGRKGVKPSDAPPEVQAEAAKLSEEYINKRLDEYDLFHGTTKKAAENIRQRGFRKGDRYSNLMGEGVYFAEDPRYAKMYGKDVIGADLGDEVNVLDLAGKSVDDWAEEVGIGQPKERMDMEGNLYDTPEEIAEWNKIDPEDRMRAWSEEQFQAVRDYVKDKGYDGIRYNPIFEEPTDVGKGVSMETVIFDPKKADQMAAGKSPVKQLFPQPAPPEEVKEVLEEIDTRGKGEFYHGTSSEISELSDGMYENANVYGQGFYTTEDLTTAFKYTKKGRGKSPSVYKITEKEPVEFFNLDEPAPPEVIRSLEDASGYAPAVDEALAQFDDLSKVSTSELFDEIRSWSRSTETSRDTIQEVFEGVQEALSTKGFGGWTHKGGVLTKSKRQHQVRIYWNPTEQIDISKVRGPNTKPKAPKAPEGSRPGFTKDVEENDFNGSTPDRPSSYEPYERAGARSSYPIQDVIADQAALRGRTRFSSESPNPALTDITARQLSAAVDDEAAYEIIEDAYKSIDVKKLRRDLITNDADVRKEALNTLMMFAEDNLSEVNMGALERTIKTSGDLPQTVIRSIIGQKVVKTLIVDTANQLRDLGTDFTEIRGAGQDGFRQAEMMFDRMKALVKLQVMDASTSGLKLQSLQTPVRSFMSPSAAKKVKDISDKLDGLKARVEEGDPVAAKELETLADSFILADGDGQMADSFIDKFFNMSRKNFETTMYNSYLSGLNTQQRNLIGNATQILLRPAEMALGSIGNTNDRQAALSMYGSLMQSMKEGLQIAKASWADFKTDGLEKATADGNMYDQLKNLRAMAKTPAQNAAAALASAQYQFMASPWLQTPMRALNAADQGFRAVSARQMAHFDFMKLAMEDGIKFDPKKFETYYSTKFKNGQIVDEQLLKYAKEDTFQEDLGVTISKAAEVIDRVPLMKYVVPFVKTPTNILKRTAHYIPLAGRIHTHKWNPLGDLFFKEYTQIMRGSDETAKAIYRGREGAGVMTAVVFSTLGFNGLATGAGPSDYEGRKRWEMEGIQPHSVKIGGVWVSNRFLGPIGILMSAYADLGMIAERQGSAIPHSDLTNQLIYTTAGSLLDQSWLKGLVGSLEYLTDAAMGQRDLNVEDSVASISRALIPYQAALRSWSNTLVPGMREYNNEFEKVLAESIPGLKSQLGAERVSLKDGKPLTNAGYSALNQITPFNLNEVRTDPVIGQLNDLGVTFPTEYMDRVSGVALTAEQKQGVHKAIAATGWYKKMEGHLESDNFTNEYDRWKNAETPESAKTSRWMRDINNMLMEAKKEGYSNYIRGGSTEAYDLEQKVTTARQAALRSGLGQYKAASEEIDKLKALGVN